MRSRGTGIWTMVALVVAAASVSAAGEEAAREAIAAREDVAVRLRADRPACGLGEVPTLKIDVLAGKPGLKLQAPAPHDIEVEVDGTWYRYAGLDFRSAVPPPAPEHKDIHVALAENAWQQGADGPRLRLTPGRHTVRVAAIAGAEGARAIRAVSNTVEIQILAEPGWGEPAGGIRIRLLAPISKADPVHLEIDLKEPVARLEVENVGDQPVRLARQNLTGGRKTAADEWLIGLYVEQWTRDGILRFARTDNADEYWTKVGGSPSVTEIRPGKKAAFGLRLDKLADAQGKRLLDLTGEVLLRPVLEVTENAAGAWSGTARGLFLPVRVGAGAAQAAKRQFEFAEAPAEQTSGPSVTPQAALETLCIHGLNQWLLVVRRDGGGQISQGHAHKPGRCTRIPKGVFDFEGVRASLRPFEEPGPPRPGMRYQITHQYGKDIPDVHFSVYESKVVSELFEKARSCAREAFEDLDRLWSEKPPTPSET